MKDAPFFHEPRELPIVLSPEKIVHFSRRGIGSQRAILNVSHEAGLCASEVAALKVSNIDGERIYLSTLVAGFDCSGARYLLASLLSATSDGCSFARRSQNQSVFLDESDNSLVTNCCGVSTHHHSLVRALATYTGVRGRKTWSWLISQF